MTMVPSSTSSLYGVDSPTTSAAASLSADTKRITVHSLIGHRMHEREDLSLLPFVGCSWRLSK